MSANRYGARLAAHTPAHWLADAWARLYCDCQSVAFVPKRPGPRVLPWAVGHGASFAAEPWPNLRKIHRRKRGFSYAVEHLQRMRETLLGLAPEFDGALEIWDQPGEPSADERLLQQWTDQTGWRLHHVDRGEQARRLAQILESRQLPTEGETNPLFELMKFQRALNMPPVESPN